MFLQVVGAAAAVASMLMFLPQAWQAWRSRGDVSALASISLGTTVMVLLNGVLWTVYNMGIENWWGVIPQIVSVPATLLILVLAVWATNRYREERRWAIPEVMLTPPETNPYDSSLSDTMTMGIIAD